MIINAIDKDTLEKIVSEALSANELLFCSRVWESWGVGTMSQNDFHNAGEDADIVSDITQQIVNYIQKSIDLKTQQ